MKILKYLFILLLILVVGLAIYTAMQPSEYDIMRTRMVEAPAEVVYNQVDDYKKWEEWGPWHEDDPTISPTYNEKTKGPGASYTWTGKDGDGKATRVESVPFESLADELDFGAMGSSTTYWKFEPKEGGTEVTWGMKAQNVPFMMKFFSAISGGYEKMMTPMFDRGLEKLDSLSLIRTKESAALMSSWRLGEISQKAEEAMQFIGYDHATKIDLKAMQQIYAESLPKAGEYAMENGLAYGEFIPGTVYTKWDEENGEAELIIGILLNKSIKPGPGMKVVTIPKGNKVTVSKFGDYSVGHKEAHTAISDYILTNGLSITGAMYELYMNDPTSVSPNEIQTDIYYPIK